MSRANDKELVWPNPAIPKCQALSGHGKLGHCSWVGCFRETLNLSGALAGEGNGWNWEGHREEEALPANVKKVAPHGYLTTPQTAQSGRPRWAEWHTIFYSLQAPHELHLSPLICLPITPPLWSFKGLRANIVLKHTHVIDWFMLPCRISAL